MILCYCTFHSIIHDFTLRHTLIMVDFWSITCKNMAQFLYLWAFNPFRPRSPIFLKLSELVDLSPNKKSEAQFCSNSRWRREIPNWNFEIATFLERSQRRTLIDKILILFAKDSQVCLLWAVKFTGINSNSLASRFHFSSEPSKISIFSNWPTLEQPIL